MSYAKYLRSLINPDVFHKGKPIFRSDFYFQYLEGDKFHVIFCNRNEEFECIVSREKVEEFGFTQLRELTYAELRKFYTYLKTECDVKRIKR